MVQQISRLQQIRFRVPACKKILGSSVELERRDVICGGLLNRSFFAGRKRGLQLVGNRGRDLTLNREYISNLAVVSLRPKRSIGRYIDQLGVDAHSITRSLDATFHY